MTTSANTTFELPRDQIIRRAYQLAGVLEASLSPTADDVSLAADFLNMELNELQARGVITRSIERKALALTPAVATYTLDSDCIDVFTGPDNFAGTAYVTSASETIVRRISREEYQGISNKLVTASVPTMVMVEKLATVQVTFWPVPSGAAFWAYEKVRLLKDMDAGTYTLDLARRWQLALTYATARHLARAKSKSQAVVQDLDRQAELRLQTLLADDRPRLTGQLAIMRH